MIHTDINLHTGEGQHYFIYFGVNVRDKLGHIL